MKTVSLTLKAHLFDELAPCHKPSKAKFVRTPGCSSFSTSKVSDNERGIFNNWLTPRSMERLFLKEKFVIWNQNQEPQQLEIEDCGRNLD